MLPKSGKAERTLQERCPPMLPEFTSEATAPAWACDPDHPIVQTMHTALSVGYGTGPTRWLRRAALR